MTIEKMREIVSKESVKTWDDQELSEMAYALQELFLEYHQMNGFEQQHEISDCCKQIIDEMMKRKLYCVDEYARTLAFVVVVVYDLDYLYTEEAKVLVAVIESEGAGDWIRLYALKHLLLGEEPEKMQFIEKNRERYIEMKNFLTGNVDDEDQIS